jgi:hypothetical protein
MACLFHLLLLWVFLHPLHHTSRLTDLNVNAWLHQHGVGWM